MFSIVDYRTKSWTCPLCHNRNPFPPHYAGITETNQPPDLNPALTTIEYILRVSFYTYFCNKYINLTGNNVYFLFLEGDHFAPNLPLCY